MLLAFWCHLLFFMVSMHKVLNNFCLSMAFCYMGWGNQERIRWFQSKTLSVTECKRVTLIHETSKPVSIGLRCHLGSSGILPHLLWQKAPQVLCHICQPHVGVLDNILFIWLRGLTLRNQMPSRESLQNYFCPEE